MFPRKSSTYTHRVDLVRLVNATMASGRWMLVDRDKIIELMNTAEPLRQGIGARENPLAARVAAMEEVIKNLTELKPVKEGDTTAEITPSSSRAASTKSTKRQISSSSDTSESDAENKKLAAERPGPSKTSTPKKSVKTEIARKKIKKEPP